MLFKLMLLTTFGLSKAWDAPDMESDFHKYFGAVPQIIRVALTAFMTELIEGGERDACTNAGAFLFKTLASTDGSDLQSAAKKAIELYQAEDSPKHHPFCKNAIEKLKKLSDSEDGIGEVVLSAGEAYFRRLLKDPCSSAILAFIKGLRRTKDAQTALKTAMKIYAREREVVHTPQHCEKAAKFLIENYGTEIGNFVAKSEL